MTTEAATPTGAEAQSRPSSEPASITDRLRASIFAPEPAQKAEPQAEEGRAIEREPAEPQERAEQEPEVEADQEPAGEAQEDTEAEAEEQKFESLSELSEALGWGLDKLLDMEAITKIDGKEGKVKLRDALKSYQLEGHLNQKLTAFADEKKAFESQAQRTSEELRGRMQFMNDAAQLAEQLLHAEFAGTNWDQLRAEDPQTYNAKVVEFQDRQRKIQQLAQAIGQERQRFGEEDAKSQATRFAEEQRLLETKIPEWADKAVAQKDIKAMAEVLESAYGITEQEVMGLTDHRMILAARDAYKWQQLQKQKPAALKKVSLAPKLIKPGTPQSRASQNGLALKQDQDRLRKTGKIRDAAPALRRLLFSK